MAAADARTLPRGNTNARCCETSRLLPPTSPELVATGQTFVARHDDASANDHRTSSHPVELTKTSENGLSNLTSPTNATLLDPQAVALIRNHDVPNTGPAAAYGFEETSGLQLNDISGRGNTGTIAGGAVRTASGRFGRAITFDGFNDMVTAADSATLDLTTARRIPPGTINTGGADAEAIGTAALLLNAWTHLAATYDGTTLRLYATGRWWAAALLREAW